MIFNETREDYRETFFTSWQKYQNHEILEPLEQQLADLILEHPEYHGFFNKPDSNLVKEFHPELDEVNPFAHLSMHLAIRDQVKLNQPRGIQKLFINLQRSALLERHEAEHAMMDCLVEQIWQVQQHQQNFNTRAYLKSIKRLVKQLAK